jgi:hypothetical protein
MKRFLPAYIGRPIGDHWCTFKETYKSEKVMPETDKAALEVAREIAKETGVKLRIYDISSFKGKIKASLRGVRKTPTIIIGKKRMEGVPKKEQLYSLVR